MPEERRWVVYRPKGLNDLAWNVRVQPSAFGPKLGADSYETVEVVPASKLKEQEERCERLEEAAKKAEDRKEFCEQSYAERIRRLTDLLKEHDLWTEGACILANGTASVKADGSYEYEPPTYAQQLNTAKWLADKAMDDYRKLQSRLGALAADFDRREQEAKAETADAPSERVQHREEGISLAFGAAAGDLRTALQHSPEDEGAAK